MSCAPEFPKLSAADYQRALRLPIAATKPLRVVLDTELDNEVDGGFALIWLLMQQQPPAAGLSRIALEAVTKYPHLNGRGDLGCRAATTMRWASSSVVTVHGGCAIPATTPQPVRDGVVAGAGAAR